MAKMTEEIREKFLAETRYGILTTLDRDGAPISVPIWFDWDGHAIRMFSGLESPKIRRIRRDARVTLLVTNHLDESEAWVAFDGTAVIRSSGVVELFEMLAEKYWDLSDPNKRATVSGWKEDADNMCVIELVPSKIRSMDS